MNGAEAQVHRLASIFALMDANARFGNHPEPAGRVFVAERSGKLADDVKNVVPALGPQPKHNDA